MPRKLFTAGYQGTAIGAFITNLLRNNIDCVLDIRALPLSRKPGFSKTQLARKLNSAKISYVHLPGLGTPKPMRDRLKSTRDYSTFFKVMDTYLAAKKDAIESAHSYVVNHRCCLMCFEHLATECHRTIVARKIKAKDRNGLQIEHI